MGQRVLPKELRTAKLNSLPEELRKIADELICDKFEIRSDGAITAEYAMANSQRVSPGVERRIDFYSRSSVFVTPITAADTRAFHDAVVRLDYENAPRSNRRAIISPPMASEFRRQPEFVQYAAYNPDRFRGRNDGEYLATIFGVPIFVVPGVVPEMYA